MKVYIFTFLTSVLLFHEYILARAQDVTAKYPLELEPNRILAGYRIRAGLEAKAEDCGGWDAVDSRWLTGHIAPHYLSTISLMYAAAGNEEFRKRADIIN